MDLRPRREKRRRNSEAAVVEISPWEQGAAPSPGDLNLGSRCGPYFLGSAAWARGRGGSSLAPSGGLTSSSTTGPSCSKLRIEGGSGTSASKLGALSCGSLSSSLQRAPSADGRCGVVGCGGIASIRGVRWE
jgi:hypothetical protein